MIIALGNIKNYLEIDTKAYKIFEIGGELWAVSHHFTYPFLNPNRVKTTSLFSCYHFESGRLVTDTHAKSTDESIERLKKKLNGVDVSQLKKQLPPYKLNKYKGRKRNAVKS